MLENQEATKEFLIESYEYLDQLDVDLVGLKKSSAPQEALGRIFRALHTIKGSCSFLGFDHLEAVAHAGEDLLGLLRDGKLPLSQPVLDALLRMVDVIRTMLSGIENFGSDEHPDETTLIQQLHGLVNMSHVAHTIVAPDGPGLGRGLAATGSLEFDLSRSIADVVASSASTEEVSALQDTSAVYDSSVRISVDLLDNLMAVAGGIVLARNQILQYSQQQPDLAFQNTCRQLDLITTELQEHVMKTRLQPIGNVWSRFPRLVHDTAHVCGKKVRLELEGSETELDKTLIEAIRDPLTHLVRNSIDHGIELPELRRAAGKPDEGLVRLRAYHEGGQVIVEISDDGGGIDPQRVRRRAVEQKLVTPEHAESLGTQTLLGLIFLPGFSTNPEVTTLSGRGVGMDVVKTNIEKIGGTVDVQSTIGHGTTVRLRIPLTLAIIKVLIVTSAGDRYAIPQVSLLELVRLEGEKARCGIEWIHDTPVYRLRGNLLPLVDLEHQLHGAAGPRGPAAQGEDKPLHIVVLQADDRPFGLVVDAVHDTEEIVVKPLQKQVKGISAFAGATIMGDGRVALILDVLGLAQKSKVISGSRQRVVQEKTAEASGTTDERQSVLLLAARDGGRLGIPLSVVDRLETFPRRILERAGTREVVQYRDQILPLIHLGTQWDGAPQSNDSNGEAGDSIQVVVASLGGQRIGLVIDRIIDIAEESLLVRSAPQRPGVLFNAVVQGRVTEFPDIQKLLPVAAGGCVTVEA